MMLGAAPIVIEGPTGGSVIDVLARAVLECLLAYLRTLGLVTS